MSTKTAFKRVALVAAAALAIGGITAVAAQAVNANLQVTAAQTGFTATAATQIAGPANSVTITNNVAGTPPAVYFTVTGGATTGGATTGTVAGSGSIVIATPTVGTITVTGYAINASNGTASSTATDTVTITVVAALPQTVYGSSTVYEGAGTTVATSDPSSPIAASASATSVANFNVTELDNSSTPLSLITGWKTITATVTNGLLSTAAGNPAGYPTSTGTTYLSGTQTAAGPVDFILSGVGLAGTSTVTISVNGVVVKTYSVTFTGAAVKIVLTAVNPVVAVGNAATLLAATSSISANTNALEVQEFDANGNAVAITPANITVTSAATTTVGVGAVSNTVGSGAANYLGGTTSGTALSSTVAGVSLNGVAAGTTTLTATDTTSGGSGVTLTSAAVSVRVSSATPTSVVITSDAAAYPAGGAGKIITTLSDSAGTLPAGTYVVFTGQETSSLALAVGTLAGTTTGTLGQVTVNDSGVNTVSFNGPLSDGTVTVSGTPAASTITVTPATFTVSSGSTDAANAATDAANEATDAANAATDAANAAADSADAATQAAQDASDQAAAALAAVTALSQQVTDLSAKIAALGASLAKITATLAKVASKVKA